MLSPVFTANSTMNTAHAGRAMFQSGHHIHICARE